MIAMRIVGYITIFIMVFIMSGPVWSRSLHNDKNEEDVLQMLQQYNAHYTQCRLKDNCRNSVAIIEKVDEIFGTETRHKHNDERGTDVVIKTHKKTADQVAALETILRMLLREGIKPEQIAILSPIRFSNSAASMVTECVVSEQPGNNTLFFIARFTVLRDWKAQLSF